MPTYGYRCPGCANEFEVWQRMTDAAGADCPTCGTASKRLFFPAGIVFKGGGFYKTDSRGAESATPAPAAKSPGDGAASGQTPDGQRAAGTTKTGQDSATQQGGGGQAADSSGAASAPRPAGAPERGTSASPPPSSAPAPAAPPRSGGSSSGASA
ncbi:MAG: FmdB family zinc ribbon protein [Candidatus Dormibacteria bacterium]